MKTAQAMVSAVLRGLDHLPSRQGALPGTGSTEAADEAGIHGNLSGSL